MSDVMVQPVRTFMEGARLVGPESEPYPVGRSRAIDLRNNGLVSFVEARAASAPAEQQQQPAAAPEAEPAPPNPFKRGRRAP